MLNLGRYGGIHVDEKDMKRTEFGMELLQGSQPEMNRQVEITGEGPDRDGTGTGTLLSLRVGAHGIIVLGKPRGWRCAQHLPATGNVHAARV